MMAKELQDWFPEAQISDQPHKLLKRFSWFIVIFPIFSRKI